MKKLIILISILLGVTANVLPQNISGRFSSSLYMFERIDTSEVTNNYVRSFQMLSLNISQDKFALRSSMNLENDLSKILTDDPRLRFYNLYFEARNLYDLVTIKLGRQPVFNSVAGGIFDGGSIDLKYDEYKFTAYYGGNVPAYQKLEFTNDLNNDYMLGGKFSTTVLPDFNIALSYVDKNFKVQDYYATRLDQNFNPVQFLISNKSNQYKFASAEVDYNLKNLFSIDTRFDYDINFEKASRFEVFGIYKQVKDLQLNLYYNYREPRIRYNSIFSVFDYGNTQEIEAGVDYAISKLFSVSGKFGNVTYKDENSQRLTAGISTNFGSITYRKNLGWAGEQDAVSLYSAYTFLEGLLTPSLGLSFTSYKLSKDSEKNNLMTLLGGVNVRPWRVVSVDLQAQYLNNKIYKNDFRFFVKLNYWFNTNLNLM